MRTPNETIYKWGGVAHTFYFENGFGASVVCHEYSYGYEAGLLEIAVLRQDDRGWGICYDTPITSDVIGYLTEEEVDDILNQIEALPATTGKSE